MSELSEVGFVQRIVVGTLDPAHPVSEEHNRQQIDLLNRCLADYPRGKIIGIEKSLVHVDNDGHQEVLQALVYHVGFTRRPAWLSS